MNNINYDFFEEFKKLEKLCGEMYGTHNGVTHYIDDMKAVSYSEYHSIPNWKADLNELIRLRHIRNNLAHVENAFNENVCTQNDISWLQTFYARILNLSDPISIHYRNSKANSKTPTNTAKAIAKSDISHNQTDIRSNNVNSVKCNQEDIHKSSSLTSNIMIFIIIVALIALIILILKDYL